MIAIEKRIRINHGSIFIFQSLRDFFLKSDPDFYFEIGSRLKTSSRDRVIVVGGTPALLQISLTFSKRSAIFLEKSDPDFYFSIDFRFSFFNRDHDRDQKCFRINRRSFFTKKSSATWMKKTAG